MSLDEKKMRYAELCHAVQSGVAYMINHDSKSTQPKHLRVGVNIALCEHSALVLLLTRKGIITEDEYWDHVIEILEAEVHRYEEQIREITGADNITLG